MLLKEIKPGMVVHCKNDDDKKSLLEEAERLCYKWRNNISATDFMMFKKAGNTVHFHERNELVSHRYITWSDKTDGVTEFSDLIIQELTAEEAIKLIGELCKGPCQECPLCGVEPYKICENLWHENPEKAVELLAKWKSDHEKKEPEIEWVYRVFGAENYGEKFFQTEEEAIKRCEELAKSQKTKQYARYERVCRVKE